MTKPKGRNWFGVLFWFSIVLVLTGLLVNADPSHALLGGRLMGLGVAIIVIIVALATASHLLEKMEKD